MVLGFCVQRKWNISGLISNSDLLYCWLWYLNWLGTSFGPYQLRISWVFSGKGAMLSEERLHSWFYTQLMVSSRGSSTWLKEGKFCPESLEWLKHLREILNCHHVLRPQDWRWAQVSLVGHSHGLRLTPGEGTGKQGRLGPLCRQGFPWKAWCLLTDAQWSCYQWELYHPHYYLPVLGYNLEPVTAFTW